MINDAIDSSITYVHSWELGKVQIYPVATEPCCRGLHLSITGSQGRFPLHSVVQRAQLLLYQITIM